MCCGFNIDHKFWDAMGRICLGERVKGFFKKNLCFGERVTGFGMLWEDFENTENVMCLVERGSQDGVSSALRLGGAGQREPTQPRSIWRSSITLAFDICSTSQYRSCAWCCLCRVIYRACAKARNQMVTIESASLYEGAEPGVFLCVFAFN